MQAPARRPTSPLSPLQRSTRLEAIYAASPVGQCFLDTEMRYVDLNDRLAKMYGRPAGDFIGHSVAEMLPEIYLRRGADFTRALAGEPIPDMEYHMPDPDTGSPRVYLSKCRTARDKAGAIIGLSCALVDITEEKRMEATLRRNQEDDRCRIELNPHIPWTATAVGEIVATSSRWYALTGLEADGILAEQLAATLHPEDLPGTRDSWQRAIREGEPYDAEYRLRCADGAWRWMRARAAPRLDGHGTTLAWYGTLEEIHDRKLAQAALRASEERFRRLYEATPSLLHTTDRRGIITEVSDRWLRVFGYARAQVVGRSQFDFMVEASALRWQRRELRTLLRDGELLEAEHQFVVKSGEVLDVLLSVIFERDQRRRVVRTHCSIEDVTLRKQVERQLVEATRVIALYASEDHLTGLGNRRQLDMELLEEIRRASRCNSALAVAMFDVDFFKAYNDHYGHIAGDDVLRAIASALRAQLRPGRDFAARYGGEEFVLVLPDTNEALAEERARSAAAAIWALAIPHAASPLGTVTVSAGVASLDVSSKQRGQHESSFSTILLRAADQALYRAKTSGRDRVVRARPADA